MALTLIVEPDHDGHRFQAVRHVAQVAARTGDVVVLTTEAGRSSEQYATFLADLGLRTEIAFDRPQPSTRQLVDAVAAFCRTHEVGRVAVLEADQALKRWWLLAPRAFARLPRSRRPTVVFLVPRFPTRLTVGDLYGWKLRVSKTLLILAAMATGSLHRASTFAGRDDLRPGWLVKHARDPAICSANARDRDTLRSALDLRADRHLLGLFGAIGERKFAPLGLDAIMASETPTDLLLAGTLDHFVQDWLRGLAPQLRARVIVREGFLSNETLDQYVAASDIALIALLLNAPSGIMGKALAAGVPVINAGSKARSRELAVTGGGIDAEFSVDGIAAAIVTLLADGAPTPSGSVPAATAEAFAQAVLGPASLRWKSEDVT